MKYLITGGAGFIGSNFAHLLLSRGDEVVIFDNFSKSGSRLNATWLENIYPKDKLTIIAGDITRDSELLTKQIAAVDVVFHLAAQTAVTTSVVSPRADLEANILGTFNVLEAVRQINPHAPLIYSSTNKVYGAMTDVPIKEETNRYAYTNSSGISELYPTDFYSPYGCSKGAADQYVHDYARIYGLKTVVFRQSCIYGPHQFGVEDQGWLAWFVIAALTHKPITIFGSGKQTRDALFVDDLFRAWDTAVEKISISAGQIYNIGGGAANSVSLLQTLKILETQLAKIIPVKFGDWRPGDQKIFISDNTKLLTDLGWQPTVNILTGLKRLIAWARSGQSGINVI